MKQTVMNRAAELVAMLHLDERYLLDLEKDVAAEWIPPALNRATAAGMIDHTLLAFDATKEQVVALCRTAADLSCKAVCVNPLWVATAAAERERLHASFLIASVIDFPLGASTEESRAKETECALQAGADEIDQVIAVGMLKSGELQKTYDLLRASVTAGGFQKVILEMSALSQTEKIDAALLARFSGAHMLKTSTGVNGKATEEDVAILRLIAGTSLGVKAAGGIRDGAALSRMVAAGADRIGASSTVAILSHWN